MGYFSDKHFIGLLHDIAALAYRQSENERRLKAPNISKPLADQRRQELKLDVRLMIRSAVILPETALNCALSVSPHDRRSIHEKIKDFVRDRGGVLEQESQALIDGKAIVSLRNALMHPKRIDVPARMSVRDVRSGALDGYLDGLREKISVDQGKSSFDFPSWPLMWQLSDAIAIFRAALNFVEYIYFDCAKIDPPEAFDLLADSLLIGEDSRNATLEGAGDIFEKLSRMGVAGEFFDPSNSREKALQAIAARRSIFEA